MHADAQLYDELSAKTAEGGREALALLRTLGDGYRLLSVYRCQARRTACVFVASHTQQRP